jgi:hypothetical protein
MAWLVVSFSGDRFRRLGQKLTAIRAPVVAATGVSKPTVVRRHQHLDQPGVGNLLGERVCAP